MALSNLSIVAFLQFIIGSCLALHSFLHSKMVFTAGWAIVAGVGVIQAWRFRTPEPLQV